MNPVIKQIFDEVKERAEAGETIGPELGRFKSAAGADLPVMFVNGQEFGWPLPPPNTIYQVHYDSDAGEVVLSLCDAG